MVAGRWADAITTADAACRRLTDPPHPALGLAHYQEGELHRLVGAFDDAETAYRQASRHGHDPVPGLALLDLVRGGTSAAATTVRRALQESHSPALRSAAVDVFLAAGDVAGAREAADELGTLASSTPSPVLHAMTSQATRS
jgi:Flp pilus assembly protein TadD